MRVELRRGRNFNLCQNSNQNPIKKWDPKMVVELHNRVLCSPVSSSQTSFPLSSSLFFARSSEQEISKKAIYLSDTNNSKDETHSIVSDGHSLFFISLSFSPSPSLYLSYFHHVVSEYCAVWVCNRFVF